MLSGETWPPGPPGHQPIPPLGSHTTEEHAPWNSSLSTLQSADLNVRHRHSCTHWGSTKCLYKIEEKGENTVSRKGTFPSSRVLFLFLIRMVCQSKSFAVTNGAIVYIDFHPPFILDGSKLFMKPTFRCCETPCFCAPTYYAPIIEPILLLTGSAPADTPSAENTTNRPRQFSVLLLHVICIHVLFEYINKTMLYSNYHLLLLLYVLKSSFPPPASKRKRPEAQPRGSVPQAGALRLGLG